MPKVNDIQNDVTLFASIKVVTPTIPNMVFTYRLFLSQVLENDKIIVFLFPQYSTHPLYYRTWYPFVGQYLWLNPSMKIGEVDTYLGE